MKTITVSNQKGGVGKSTIAVHLAISLEEKNYKVLFIDLDPQANASSTLERIEKSSNIKASQLFKKESINININEKITLISADNKMADIERASPEVLNFFKENLNKMSNSFNFCIIDTPPTLGLRMTAALIMSQYVLSPIELEEYSIDGITKMLQTIFGVKKQWNPELEFLGMLPNRFNSKSLAQKETLTELINNYSNLLIPAKISTRSSIPESLALGIPVWKLKKTAAKTAALEFKEAFNIIYKKIGVDND